MSFTDLSKDDLAVLGKLDLSFEHHLTSLPRKLQFEPTNIERFLEHLQEVSILDEPDSSCPLICIPAIGA